MVTINVTPVNDAPVALADGPYVTTQDVPLVVPAGQGVLTNDSDPETTTLTAVAGTATPDGILQLNANGSFTFTPKSGFAGTTSFTYRASDGTAQSAPATVSIQVTDIPDAPVAAADSYTVAKNSPLIVSASRWLCKSAHPQWCFHPP